jgi:hypothetical protein
MVDDLEGSGRGPIEILYRHLAGGTEENDVVVGFLCICVIRCICLFLYKPVLL